MDYSYNKNVALQLRMESQTAGRANVFLSVTRD